MKSAYPLQTFCKGYAEKLQGVCTLSKVGIFEVRR